MTITRHPQSVSVLLFCSNFDLGISTIYNSSFDQTFIMMSQNYNDHFYGSPETSSATPHKSEKCATSNDGEDFIKIITKNIYH